MATRHNETFYSLGSRIAALPRRRATLLIGIDAPGGAGKSTFSRSMRRVLPTATIVAMDDFFLPSYARLPAAPSAKPIGGDFEWQRVQRQVLAPLACEQPAAYQRYDWDTDQLAEWHSIAPGGLVVVEGCYALHQALASYYDFTIWLECPRAIRVARGIARGGERVREKWEHDWMVAEDRYVAAQHPRDRATLVVDSSGTSGHDPEDCYVSLSL